VDKDLRLEAKFLRDFQNLEDDLEKMRRERKNALDELDALNKSPQPQRPTNGDTEKLKIEIQSLRDQLSATAEKARRASKLAKARARLLEQLREAKTASDRLEQENSRLARENSKLKVENQELKRRDRPPVIPPQTPSDEELRRRVEWACRERDNYKAMLESANFRIRDLERQVFSPPH
jgi:DNA repair exonuclease SbcCD ATPase subunit